MKPRSEMPARISLFCVADTVTVSCVVFHDQCRSAFKQYAQVPFTQLFDVLLSILHIHVRPIRIQLKRISRFKVK